jgi:hypothetical protein
MFGKLSVALLIASSPAVAQEQAQPTESENAEAQESQPVAYKTKKVCRSIEVVGSSIPRMSCTTKRIPIKPVEEEADTGADTESQSGSQE